MTLLSNSRQVAIVHQIKASLHQIDHNNVGIVTMTKCNCLDKNLKDPKHTWIQGKTLVSYVQMGFKARSGLRLLVEVTVRRFQRGAERELHRCAASSSGGPRNSLVLMRTTGKSCSETFHFPTSEQLLLLRSRQATSFRASQYIV